MYKIVIPHTQQGQSAIELQTKSRIVARYAKLLGSENDLEVRITETREPRPVKFKGVD